MNRTVFRAWLVAGSGICLPAVAGAAVLTVDTVEPTGPGVVIAHPHSTYSTGSLGPLGERDTFTRAFSAAGGYGDRGQTFVMPDSPLGAWDLSSITLRADAQADGTGVAQDLASNGPNTLKLWIFEWAPGTDGNVDTQWAAGDGSTDGDPFNGTGITNFLVNGETFDITRSFNGEFLHFNTPGVQLAENTAYGVLVSFASGGSALRFQIDEVRDNGTNVNTVAGESYPLGGLLRSDASTNTLGDNGDDLVFYVQATPIPEPAAMSMLGLASLGLLSRRPRGGRSD